METGGGIKKALNLIGNEPFLTVNGDIYTDFRFSDLPEQLHNDCLAHLVVRKNEDEDLGDLRHHFHGQGTGYSDSWNHIILRHRSIKADGSISAR